jgi:hypothetical protein
MAKSSTNTLLCMLYDLALMTCSMVVAYIMLVRAFLDLYGNDYMETTTWEESGEFLSTRILDQFMVFPSDVVVRTMPC